MIAKPTRAGFLPRADAGAAFDLPDCVRAADLWDAWRFAAVESALALKDWMIANSEEKALGYEAYLACLDHEEEAATALAEHVDPDAAIRLRTRP